MTDDKYLVAVQDSVYLQVLQMSPTQARIYPRAKRRDGDIVRMLFAPGDLTWVDYRGFWILRNLGAYANLRCIQIASRAFSQQLELPI